MLMCRQWIIIVQLAQMIRTTVQDPLEWNKMTKPGAVNKLYFNNILMNSLRWYEFRTQYVY